MKSKGYTGMNSEWYIGMNSEWYIGMNRERPVFYKIKIIALFHGGILRSGDKVTCILKNLHSK
jgi:hypothetical protein